ncbi:MAG: L-serine ammonia-lyase, iron-sulfur-dependent subunit beta [Thermotogae bacterium]|nr:L-serine ammonia-lyase, iron-sulfur-dependent subunit beta [Thermotogota bacterium]MCL5032355.1 L-serine ammonia-lyase, iron-sulfur-dependent subunit beta [Thermotogota bacterium]
MISIIDVIGPSMIGPSSSHTLGAMRISKFVYNLFNSTPDNATFYLHGSFKDTYIGHGTGLALVAGLCGMATDDPSVSKADEISKRSGFNYEFKAIDLGDVHPNTVKIVATKDNLSHEVIGSSVGGGRIKIISIDSISCNITGELPTLVIENDDVPGALESIVRVISLNSVNIAQVSLSRISKGSKIANMILELDDELDNSIIENLRMLKIVKSMIYVKSLNYAS